MQTLIILNLFINDIERIKQRLLTFIPAGDVEGINIINNSFNKIGENISIIDFVNYIFDAMDVVMNNNINYKVEILAKLIVLDTEYEKISQTIQIVTKMTNDIYDNYACVNQI